MENEKCQLCGNTNIYKYDGQSLPICQGCLKIQVSNNTNDGILIVPRVANSITVKTNKE